MYSVENLKKSLITGCEHEKSQDCTFFDFFTVYNFVCKKQNNANKKEKDEIECQNTAQCQNNRGEYKCNEGYDSVF